MPGPDSKPNNHNEEDPEIAKLRQAVLKWIGKKPAAQEDQQISKAKKELQPSIEDLDQVKQPQAEKPATQPEETKLSARHAPKDTQEKIFQPTKSMHGKRKKGKNKSRSRATSTSRPTADLKKMPSRIIIVGLVVVILALVIFGLALYLFKWQGPLVSIVTKIIPYPAVVVNFKPLSYYDWQNQVTTLQNFYAKEKISNPELLIPSLSQTQNHILDRMIENQLLVQLAKKYNISIPEAEIDQQIQDLIAEIGSREGLEAQLKDLYNWTIDDFGQEIIKPLLLKVKVGRALILDERINQSAKAKAQAVLDQAREELYSFEQLAQRYSEDITAVQGGDLGYFSKGQMTPEFEQAAFALKAGEVSDIVKTQFGYHIIKIEEILMDENDEIIQVRAKHILIRGKDLDTYLQELKGQATIWKLVKI